MGEREHIAFADVIEIISGGTPKTSVAEYWNGNIPWLSVADFNTGYRWVSTAEKHITERGLAESPTTLLGKGDIIISARGTVGALAQLSVPMAFNQSCYGIRGRSGVSDTNFIYYALHDAVETMKQIAHGGVFDTITRDTFKLLELRLPPLPEQRAIAHILGTLDDKIELNRRQSETLQEMARALFKAWFVDFEPVRAKMSRRWQRGQTLPGLPAHLWDLFPDRLVETEHGEVPLGWTIEPFASAIDFKEGPGIRNWQYTNSEDGIRFINIRCIQNGDLALASANRIAEEEANGKYRHFLLQPWDIVVSTSGTLGRSAIVREEHLPLVLNTSVIRFRPVHGKTAFSYIHQYLTGEEFLEKLDVMASGSVQKNFGPMHLKQIGLLLPSFDVMQKYEAICRPIYERVLSYRSQSDTLTTLRDTLLPQLLSGALRVADAEAFLATRGL